MNLVELYDLYHKKSTPCEHLLKAHQKIQEHSPYSGSDVDNLAVYKTPPASPAWLQVGTSGPPSGQSRSGRASGMDGDEQRRGQYDQSNYPRGYAPAFGGQGASAQRLRGPAQGDGSERFRQGQLLTTRPASSASLAAGSGGSHELASFGYAPAQQYATTPMQPTSFSYQPDYLQESQRHRYPQYQSQMMYNVAQQPPQQSPYQPVGQYQPRQSAAVEVLSSQFGMPQQYYNHGEVSTVSGSTVIPQGYQTAAYQQPMQYNAPSALGRSTLASSYPTTAPDYSQAGSSEEQAQPEQEPDTRAEQFVNYQTALRETNESTSRGRLIEAAVSLEKLSEWLLTHAAGLGLSRDDQTLHAQRIELWDNFNNCWLALLQRQKDDTQQMLDSGKSPRAPRSLLPIETLRRLGDNLVAQADELERLGLVDYQMGVAEEEIITILSECIDLLSTDEEDIPEAEVGGS